MTTKPSTSDEDYVYENTTGYSNSSFNLKSIAKSFIKLDVFICKTFLKQTYHTYRISRRAPCFSSSLELKDKQITGLNLVPRSHMLLMMAAPSSIHAIFFFFHFCSEAIHSFDLSYTLDFIETVKMVHSVQGLAIHATYTNSSFDGIFPCNLDLTVYKKFNKCKLLCIFYGTDDTQNDT